MLSLPELLILTHPRALCRIKLLPVTLVLVDTWMLTVKPVYKLLNVSDDLKWTTNTHVTPFSPFFCSLICLPVHNPSTIFLPVHIRFYPSKWRVDGSLHEAMTHPLTTTVKSVIPCPCHKWHDRVFCHARPLFYTSSVDNGLALPAT